MPFQVVHAKQGLAGGQCYALGSVDTDDKRADEPGPFGNSDALQLRQGHASRSQCLLDYRHDLAHMCPGCQLWDHPPV